MTARYVSAATGIPVKPHPDDFCRYCRGSGRVSEYHGLRLVTVACLGCDGTGYSGLRFAPAVGGGY